MQRAVLREALDAEFSVFREELAVYGDLRPFLQVLYHVPVQCRDVLATRFWVGPAERHVEGAAYLLVEECVLGERSDARIGAESELAETPRALVHVEHLVK